MDGNSEDKTQSIVKRLADKIYPLKYIFQKEKNGLAGAYLEGFKYALANDYDHVIEMDADFSHDPKYLATMDKLKYKYDFVIGSRYVLGGGTENWNFFRKILSRGGSLYAKIILGVKINDLTGGFNLWSRKVLEGIDLNSIKSQGYCFQIELKYKANKGYSYIEFPIIFKERKAGISKMNWKIAAEAIWKVPLLRKFQIPKPKSK